MVERVRRSEKTRAEHEVDHEEKSEKYVDGLGVVFIFTATCAAREEQSKPVHVLLTSQAGLHAQLVDR